ncbi:MAG: hypothetical protein J6V98_04385 [Bacteroidales bacterium]|nr:hypothetical protein [Bacteroidales bacterium]
MRRRWIVTVLVLLLFTAVGVLVKRCPRTVPFEQCSELYQHYADTEGIEASFIQGYRLNDSLRVDVTLLQATDSVAWGLLMADFKIKELPPEIQQMVDQHSSITIKKLYEDQEEEPSTYDVAAIARKEQTILIFHFDSNKYNRDFVIHQIQEMQKENRKK